MKQTGKTGNALLEARELLAQLTPLNRDCGKLCQHACCKGPGGMMLYVGEAALYQQLPQGFSISRDNGFLSGGRLLTCRGTCDRSTRPLACRIFPLQFMITEDGAGDVCLDPRAWAMCPLMDSGIEGLSADFVLAARQAARVLAEDDKQRAFILNQQQAIAKLTKKPWEEEGVG